MQVMHMKCNGEFEPRQVDRKSVNFSWNLKSNQNGAKQLAYRIVVKSGSAVLWDTGKRQDENCMYIPYAGEELKASTRYAWELTVWNQEDVPAETEEAFFETGLEQWLGEWIGYDEPVDGKIFDPKEPFYCADDYSEGKNNYFLPPPPYLRKEFVFDKEVENAKLYISAFGLADVQVNGLAVSDALFVPGISNYAQTVYSVSADVTEHLQNGKNTISVILADGWYAGYIGLNNREWYGSRPRVLLQLEIQGRDGSRTIITTDKSWKAAYGGIREADVFEGEKFDALMEPEGWRRNDFDDSNWSEVETGAENPLTPVAHPGVHIVEHQRIPCAERIALSPSKVRLRFDEYICGVLNLKLRGEAGARIVIRHAEILNDCGELHLEGNRSARNQDEYVLSGEGVESFAPKFTYHGFRYADIEMFGKVEILEAEGVQIGTKLMETTTFETNDETANTVFRMVLATEKANLFDIPTDCTARDERLGWGNEGNHFLAAMTYINNQYRMLHKWAKDIWDGQRENGGLEAIAPTMMMKDVEGYVGDIQSNHGVHMVYTLYRMYGDLQAVREYFPKMLKFFDYLECNSDRNLRAAISCDWLGILEETGHSDVQHGYGECASTVIGTSHYLIVVDMMVQMCEAIGEREYAQKYAKLREEILRTFRQHYIQRDGSLRYKKQGDYLITLASGGFEKEYEGKAADFLEEKLLKNGYVQWYGGTPTTPYLLGTLKRLGKVSLANQFITSRRYPSIGYMNEKGFDTIWERWDGIWEDGRLHPQAMNALCHEGYAVVGSYLIAGLAGIDTLEGGFKKILICPGASKEVTACRCTYVSNYGAISTNWKWEKDVFDIKLEIPANTTARVVLPCEEQQSLCMLEGKAEAVSFEENAVVLEIASGKYHFTTSAAIK